MKGMPLIQSWHLQVIKAGRTWSQGWKLGFWHWDPRRGTNLGSDHARVRVVSSLWCSQAWGRGKQTPHLKTIQEKVRKRWDEITPCSPFQKVKNGCLQTELWWLRTMGVREGISSSALSTGQFRVGPPPVALRDLPGHWPATGCREALRTCQHCRSCLPAFFLPLQPCPLLSFSVFPW